MTSVTGDWLTRDATQRVMAMLEEAGFVAYAVGGCVRNALLGEPVADVDISTDARPETVIALAEAARLKAVPTGIDHGTITVVCDGQGYEITTFRADIETDGRRAVVRFATDVAEDALRRDFTMNALYADRRGTLIDPLGGLPDLLARRFRFIEDPATRIREDYLRILRFFRFSAWYADPAQGMDPEALAAIAANLDGLGQLSAERVGAETLKLLSAPDPLFAVSVMHQTGVLAHVLPGAVVTALGPLIVQETALGLPADPLRRMAVMGFFDSGALRLSKAQQKHLALYQNLIGASDTLSDIAYRHGAETARDLAALRAASFETAPDPDALARIDHAAQARFPVTARDLMPDIQGPDLGQTLRDLEAQWIASDFTLDRNRLLARVKKA